jgi:hypothetical protein
MQWLSQYRSAPVSGEKVGTTGERVVVLGDQGVLFTGTAPRINSQEMSRTSTAVRGLGYDELREDQDLRPSPKVEGVQMGRPKSQRP